MRALRGGLLLAVFAGAVVFLAAGVGVGQEPLPSGAAGHTDDARRPSMERSVGPGTDETRSPAGADETGGPGGNGAPDPAVAAAEGMADIHDIRPPAPPRPNPWRWALWAGAALLAAAAAISFLAARARRRRKLRAGAAPAMAPEQRAVSALRGLENRMPLEDRTFYFELTAVLRRYLEERYRFPAGEMTTEELRPILGKLDGLPPELADGLEALLVSADAVKFAGISAAERQMTADLDFANRLVRETTPVVPEAETEG